MAWLAQCPPQAVLAAENSALQQSSTSRSSCSCVITSDKSSAGRATFVSRATTCSKSSVIKTMGPTKRTRNHRSKSTRSLTSQMQQGARGGGVSFLTRL